MKESFPTFSPKMWKRNTLSIIPITEYSFDTFSVNIEDKLNHGYIDVDPIFPSYKQFLNRSLGKDENYPRYMTFLLCKKHSKEEEGLSKSSFGRIIGVLAVQLATYESLRIKNEAIVPEIDNYLYLSWIALDKKYHSNNYFSFLFEYYITIVRWFRKNLSLNLEGTAVIIRRMRQVIWALFNSTEDCPTTVNRVFSKDSPRFKIVFTPVETFDPSAKPKRDYLLIHFKQRKI